MTIPKLRIPTADMEKSLFISSEGLQTESGFALELPAVMLRLLSSARLDVGFSKCAGRCPIIRGYCLSNPMKLVTRIEQKTKFRPVACHLQPLLEATGFTLVPYILTTRMVSKRRFFVLPKESRSPSRDAGLDPHG